ncbi:UDP-4-amino-4,6-dideoxy-N-acetyl-beta-L-altrosamine transaminase [bacterium]|nr:UDP-4-amino-4,6-dideoxy-N-acetyl-beta-L-altrosamine transaminase [bacterium]
MIPYGRQDVNEKDIDKVVNVLRSDFITQGPVIENFERRVANYCRAKFAYSCNSATSALHVACLALGVGKDDLVWTSPISFVASSNCALYCGARVDFVDINPLTYNMSTLSLEKKLIEAEKNNDLPKVVIPVHLAGQSCEMDKIFKLSKKYNFKIIEDASHAIGAKYKGKPVGNCSFSDISVFSFHPVKIITTCEGGMCLTNNKELGNLISRYRSHGITRQPSEMTKAPDGSWYYEQLNLGLNYRMNDVQAALGLSQMDRLEEFISRRRDIASRYNEMLKNSIVEIPNQHPDTLSSYHLYIIRIKKNKKITHKQLFEKFRAAGVLVNIHYIPIYRQPYYKALGFEKHGFEESEKYYNEAISIPIFPGLTSKEQKKVVDLIEEPVGFQNLF